MARFPQPGIWASSRTIRFQRAIQGWAAQGLRTFPWRVAGSTPYQILVAELLLKRTTATAAARLYPGFLRLYPTLARLALASEQELADALAPIGLQSQRAKSIRALTRYLIEHNNGTIPSELKQLLLVPGLGAYAARAVLSFGHDRPEAVVDSNVHRVLARVFANTIGPKTSQAALQSVADHLLPNESHREYNFALLDLGADVCRYDRPRCGSCPLEGICESAGIPIVKPKPGPLGVAIRKARQTAGLSLVQLAKVSGCSKATLVAAEAGRTQPLARTLDKIELALGSPSGALSHPRRHQVTPILR